MKVRGERVDLLVLGDRTIRFERGIKLKNNIIITEDGRGYYRGSTFRNSVLLFLQARVKGKEGNEIKIEDLYQAYVQFCQEYELEITPFNKFIDIIGNYVEIDGEKGVIRDIEVVDKAIEVKENDIYLYEKQGLFTRKKKPVYIVVEGIPKTITFDELKGYAVNSNNHLITLDDFTLGQMLSESMFLGATMGSQKMFTDLKWFSMFNTALVFILLILVGYLLLMNNQILEILKRLL